MSPSNTCHKEKSEGCYQLYDFINKNTTSFLGWEASILFYAALHCVNYFFASPPVSKHPNSHKKTNKLVSRHLRNFATDYLFSYQVSRWARYFDINITNTMRDTCLRNYNAVKSLVP